MTPETVRMMQEFVRLLLQGEEAAMREMALRWVLVERALGTNAELLAREVADRQAAGKRVTPDTLRELSRFQDLLRQVLEEMDSYSHYASDAVAARQALLARHGISQAVALLRASTGVTGAFDVLPVAAIELMVGYVRDGTPLQTYFKTKYPEAVKGIMDALLRGLALGQHPTKIAREMVAELGVVPRTAINSARTETLRVYREATLGQYRASGLVDGYIRVAAKSERTCLACLAKDGEWFPLDVSFEEHNQGRCSAIPAKRGAVYPGTQGLDWFERQPADVQRRMMGNGRYEAWKAGKFDLRDVAKLHEDSTWGNSWQEKSLAELVR